MKTNPLIYVLSESERVLSSIPTNFRIKRSTDKIILANDITDCLNAEKNKAEIVIWSSTEYDQLEELSPIKSAYGWMIVSINIPILFHITNIDQLSHLENIRLAGFYSEDLELLKETQKRVAELSE